MKKIQSVLVSAALAIGMATPASAGVNDPEVLIYRFPGVTDSGAGIVVPQVATAFHCTNFSGATETIRFVTRNFNTGIANNSTVPIDHLATVTAATHCILAYNIQLNMTAGVVNQGTTAIAATSINIICTAETVFDATTTAPHGVVARRGIRFNPVPGSQE